MTIWTSFSFVALIKWVCAYKWDNVSEIKFQKFELFIDIYIINRFSNDICDSCNRRLTIEIEQSLTKEIVTSKIQLFSYCLKWLYI